MSPEFSFPVRVYIEDTDAGGIVYYVNYLKYLERARTELMRDLGHAKAALSDDGLMYVVSEVSVRYRMSAMLDDELMVRSHIASVGGATLDFQQKIYRGDTLLVEGEIRVACVDQTSGRPRRLPRTVRDAICLSAGGDHRF